MDEIDFSELLSGPNVENDSEQDEELEEAPDLDELLNKAMFEMADILVRVRDLATGERTRLVELGWNQENAESMAMAVYGTFLSQLTGGIR